MGMFKAGRRICLIYYCPIVQIYKPVPLKNIDYHVDIRGPIALVRLTQVYMNTTSHPINVTYEFPRTEDSCFTRFEATFQDRTVLGQIKQKEQARAEFEAHKAIGSTVAYAEMKNNEEDIMKIELGNFPAAQSLTITFTYVEPLDLIASHFWKLVIPSTLTPRYMGSSTPSMIAPDHDSLNAGFAAKFGGAGIPSPLPPTSLMGKIGGRVSEYTLDTAYTWNITVDIYQQTGDATLFCATHKNEVSIEKVSLDANQHKTTVQLSPGAHYPKKDFEIMFTDNNFNKPLVEVMVKNDLPDQSLPKRCAMMHLVPKFADYAKFDAEGNLIPDEAEEISHYMDCVKAEFVFIIDRSGSMDGERISIAVNAVILALRSLPYDSYFNIVSFGSNFNFMFPTSVKADQTTISTAIAKVSSFRADMGGTEILAPMNALFYSPNIPRYQRSLILLTDGSVSNSEDVIKKTRENCVLNRFRVFTVGIGNGVSEQFIKGVAKAGNGTSDIIHNLNIIEDKIISLLKASYSPSLSNFRLEYDQNAIEAIAPFYNKDSHVLQDKPLQLYAFLRNHATGTTNIKLTYYDSVQKKDIIVDFAIDSNRLAGDQDYFHKLMVREMIRDSDYGLNKAVAPGQWQTNIAVSYQVLCEKTAFICVIKDARLEGGTFASANVIVPTIQTVDYRTCSILGSYNQVAGLMMQKLGGPPPPGCALPSFAVKKHQMVNQTPVPFSMNIPMAPPMMSMSAGPERSKRAASAKEKCLGDMKVQKKKKQDSSNQNLMKAGVFMASAECEEEQDDCFMDDEGATASSFNPSEAKIDAKPAGKPAVAPGPEPNSVIKLQQYTGEYSFNASLLANICKTYAVLGTQLKIEGGILMTLLVTAWLKKYHNSQKFLLIINKSIAFMKSKGLIYKDLETEVLSSI
jgi:Vault protein inter-alpha-trypsin domain/von Willebrand factor type A domain